MLGFVHTGDPAWAEVKPVCLDSTSTRDSGKLLPQTPSVVEPDGMLWTRQNEVAFPAPRKGTLDTHLSLALGLISCHFSRSE